MGQISMISINKYKTKYLRIEGTKHAQKTNKNSSEGHGNHKSYKKEINATMKASIHSDERFSTKW
jgi:hypothetical protein